MKIIKCDRCGLLEENHLVVNYGISEFYMATLRRYVYSEVPEFRVVDLCNSCAAQLNSLADEFMRGDDK